jgi:ABC-type sugar transport system ATPase subunit
MNLVTEGMTTIGFRPEHFQPVDGHEAHPSDRLFTFVAHREEYLGSERLVYGAVEADKVVARFPATLHHEIEMGVPLDFKVSHQHLKYFDHGTGLRIEQPV